MNKYKERVWTRDEILNMRRNEWITFRIIISAKAWGMLGINYKEKVEWYWDKINDSFIVKYK